MIFLKTKNEAKIDLQVSRLTYSYKLKIDGDALKPHVRMVLTYSSEGNPFWLVDF